MTKAITNIYLSAMACLIAGAAGADIFYSITLFCLTLFIYSLNALTDVEDGKRSKIHIWLCLLSLPAILLSIKVFVLALTGILYSVGRYRLKNIPLIKNVVVALVWTFAVLPVQDQLTLKIGLFLTTFVNTVLCDVRDANSDARAGIKTVANLFGGTATALLVLVIALAPFLGLLVIPPLWSLAISYVNKKSALIELDLLIFLLLLDRALAL